MMPPAAPTCRSFRGPETARGRFPRRGKLFSTLWKTAVPALGLCAAAAGAALPEPPALPFPLPAADLGVRQSSTVYAPDRYLHVAVLTRPFAEYELADFSAALAQRNWKAELADGARASAALEQLRALAPTSELQQPYDAALQLVRGGLQSWTLDAIQLLYAPGENAALCLTFPLPPDAGPAGPGAFTADLPLPLHDAAFVQAAIQAEAGEITRTETWTSQLPPELFLPQADQILAGVGWVPPVDAAPPAADPENRSVRAKVALMESLLNNLFRVYHRGTSQLTILHVPGDGETDAGPVQTYTFVLRTLLQWPLPPPG